MSAKICPNGHKYTGDRCFHCPDPDFELKRPVRKTRMFGTTIRETVEILQAVGSPKKAQRISVRERNIIYLRTIASLVLAGVAVYFFTQGKQDVGFGLGGSIVGYWLK